MNIYVGNLSPRTSRQGVHNVFSRYGTVGKISLDDRTREGKAHCSCFVEMPSESEASTAVVELNGSSLDGNVLTIRMSGVRI